MPRRYRPVQMELPLRSWGGKRAGAGRKSATGRKRGVPHVRRPELKARHPVHVTMRLQNGLPGLRHKPLAAIVFAAFRAARELHGARLVQFSVQSNHLHLLVEATGRNALSRAMQGLATRVARRVNGKLGRRGSVFEDRYHARALRTPVEVRRALVYVLHNHKHHLTGAGRASSFDPLSTAPYFDGFTARVWRWPRDGFIPPKESPVVMAKTWLLRIGWRRLGLITPHERPA
jgi:putative transposase